MNEFESRVSAVDPKALFATHVELIRGDRCTVLDYDDGLTTRRIAFGMHCFGCTALAGSSLHGALT